MPRAAAKAPFGLGFRAVFSQAQRMTARWFDDISPGDACETDGATLTEPQILDFALQWDPQPFHLDRQAAEASAYGGLIASGFQTMLTAFRLILATRFWSDASMGSPGMEDVRWVKPVRPGDTIRARFEVLETRASRSKPDRGVATIAYTVLNQNDEEVMRWRCAHILKRRPPV